MCFVMFYSCMNVSVDVVPEPWSKEKANEWYKDKAWPVGCNFIPSTAINQLEMWQEETYDRETIDMELGWAADLGFNTVRVYLHNVVWEADAEGFKDRIDDFLKICDSHGIKAMFVFFDDCWYGNAQLGKQLDPDPGLHNSFWLQCPRYSEVMDESVHPSLKAYLQDIMEQFKDDERILLWDLYNEPANNHFVVDVFPFVKKVVQWAREVAPSQPITIGVWKHQIETAELNRFQLENSDVISYHNYSDYESMKKSIYNFKSFGRPVICSEYLARGNKSKFQTHMPMMKREKVGAINWGLVFGKTQTVYPWNTPLNAPVPEVWHHDIFWKDGTPYDEEEVKFIKRVTGKMTNE